MTPPRTQKKGDLKVKENDIPTPLCQIDLDFPIPHDSRNPRPNTGRWNASENAVLLSCLGRVTASQHRKAGMHQQTSNPTKKAIMRHKKYEF